MKLFYELDYRFFRMPWEMGPRKELVKLVEGGRIVPCRAIDLGCGTGSNAVFLAQQGFDVVGVDFAASAVQKGKQKANHAKVRVQFVVDDLINLQKVQGTFDFLVNYGTLDDLQPKDRDPYLHNVLRLTNPGSWFLLWCFEWSLRWWERFPFSLALEPGEVERRFGEYFRIERITGRTNLSGWPRGFGVYLMMRRPKKSKVKEEGSCWAGNTKMRISLSQGAVDFENSGS